MDDLRGEIARLNVLLSEARARADRLEKLRVLGVEMRRKQIDYFKGGRHPSDKHKAMSLERRWDALAAEADPVEGKPVVKFAQAELFPEVEINRIGGADADIVPMGPQVKRLLAQMTVVLAKPAGCANCLGPGMIARSHQDHSLDVLMWIRGYLSSALACGLATDPEDAARQLVDGEVDLRAY